MCACVESMGFSRDTMRPGTATSASSGSLTPIRLNAVKARSRPESAASTTSIRSLMSAKKSTRKETADDEILEEMAMTHSITEASSPLS